MSCRYRWPDEVRDEVLARLLAHLLALNPLTIDPTPGTV